MRLVLALEASSGSYDVAVGTGHDPAAQQTSSRADPEFKGLGELVLRTLSAAGAAVRDVDAIAVDVGPGSLSSIRAAVAYANGLAFSLGIPIWPAISLQLMAAQARPACRGPVLCLRKGEGRNAYAGLFSPEGEAVEMRYGPRASILPAMVSGLTEACFAGAYQDEVFGLLPEVKFTDTGVVNPDVITLYRAARAAGAHGQLVSAASPVNEGSKILHEPAASRHQP
jgi:tRNA threonylcarbamoyladenosine biosynthesis protein TsaB